MLHQEIQLIEKTTEHHSQNENSISTECIASNEPHQELQVVEKTTEDHSQNENSISTECIAINEPIQVRGHDEQDTIQKQITIEAEESELLGKKVQTKKQAYEMYNDYAFKHGFGIRHSRKRNHHDGTTMGQEFCCNKQGIKTQDNSGKKYTKVDTRTKCKAMVYFKIDQDSNWIVVRHIMEHNHDLCPQQWRHNIRSQREVTQPEKDYLHHLKQKGIGVATAYRCLKAEVGGSPAVGFSLRDAYNAVDREHKSTFDRTDSNTLINIFKNRMVNEEDFYFDFEIDPDLSLVSFFWRDQKMKEDYTAFGDLVVFDTTYRTNKHALICAPFVGMNNHTHNCMFGCGFLFNERIESFEWLFNTFLKSMDGLYPKTIMTDQAFSMAAAIKSVFPSATHRLCVWHIGENSRLQIRELRKKEGFVEAFDHVTKKCHTTIEFDYFWNKMVKDFNCQNEPWLKRLYELKDKWCRAFTKEQFSGGILSSQRSESTNNALTRRLYKSASLCDFYNCFGEVVGEWRSNEGRDNERCWEGYPQPRIPFVKILHHASKVYTIEAYKVFEWEFMSAMSHKNEIKSEEESIKAYLVWIPGKDVYGQVVTYDAINHNVCCTCKRFEEFGFLCRHILRIYHIHSVDTIPNAYILKRWTRVAKETNNAENATRKKAKIHGGVWRLLMQRKYHKLLMASDSNESCRNYLEELFEKGKKYVEEQIGRIVVDEGTNSSSEEEVIADPKSKRDKYESNKRKKSILEVKTKAAKKKKKNKSAKASTKKADAPSTSTAEKQVSYFPLNY